MKKPIQTIFSTLALLLSVPALALSNNSFNEFTDVPPSHPNYNAITLLRYYGVISGYEDNSFRPEQPINRVEALKLVFEVGGFETKPIGLADFSDTDKTAWYAPYLNRAVYDEIIGGYPDKTFRPTQTINQVEFLKMLTLAQKADLVSVDQSKIPFTDVDPSQWYMKYIWFANEHKLVVADAENKVYPAKEMSRGDAAEIIFRYRQYQDKLSKNPVVDEKEDGETAEPEKKPENILPADFATFQSESFFFAINYPKKWFYSSLESNTAGVIRVYGFGPDDLSADGVPLVTLELWPLNTEFTPNYTYQGVALQKEELEGLIKLTRKVDGQRVYRLTGLSDQLDNMLIMLESLEKYQPPAKTDATVETTTPSQTPASPAENTATPTE